MANQPSRADRTSARQQLPVRRTSVVELRGLTIAGDVPHGAAPVRGLDLTLAAGTLSVLAPADVARTVLDYLAGRIPSEGPDRGHSSLRTHIVSAVDGSDSTVEQVLAEVGDWPPQTARLLGLGPIRSTPTQALGASQRLLVALATSLTEAPDLIAFIDPFTGWPPAAVASFVNVLREVVDTQGRTVVLVLDSPDSLLAESVSCFDRQILLEPPQRTIRC